MAELLIPILIIVIAPAIMFFWSLPQSSNFINWIKHFKSLIPQRNDTIPDTLPAVQPDMDTLNCRIQLTEKNDNSSLSTAFSIEICGSIHAPDDIQKIAVQISIMDITDRPSEAKPVHTPLKQWQKNDSSAFDYTVDIGTLPEKVAKLIDWTAVAQLSLDWLLFPRKGKRNLQFNLTILSTNQSKEIASAKSNLIYENPAFGYIDLQENIQRTRILAVGLAFAVSAADRKLFKSELDTIKDWARDKINFAQTSEKAKRQFEEALNRTVAFFRDGNQLDTYGISKEITEIAPFAECCDILELCMKVARTKGSVSSDEMTFLKNLSNWLNIDDDRFQAMMEKFLPVNMHQVKNVQAVLGITSDMNREKARLKLNKEYSKWNSRVTNSDPEIQNQADQMLKLIAESRNEYIGLETAQM